MSCAGLGLLTGLPVLLFAVAIPLAGKLVARVAPRRPSCPARPPFAAWLNAATQGWTAPILLILAATLASTITGLIAARISGRFPRGGPGAREVL